MELLSIFVCVSFPFRDAFRKKRKKIQTIVKKVGGGSPQTQNKNLKLILDKSIGREGAKSVCQNLNIILKV